MLSIAIIDDIKQCALDMEAFLLQAIDMSECNVEKYDNEYTFLENIENGVKYDIVFLDIVLNNMNGIDVAKKINMQLPYTNIIFVSANEDYFKDVYGAKHCYFLTKPLEMERFNVAILMALNNLKNNGFFITTKKGKYKILFDDILFLESSLKNTRIHFSNNTIAEYAVSLLKIEDKLPRDKFLRTHKSFIVNLDLHIGSERSKIYMPYEKVVPISKKHVNLVREKMILYLGGALCCI